MTDAPQLRRHLGLFDATTLVVGSMIGSAIFFGAVDHGPVGADARGC